MGSIVSSIGKAIKGIGKAIKKIAPVLLLAAAVYVGYGFMTGFGSGGWPQIANWGKSLMSSVAGGSPISAAAQAATATAPPATAVTSAPIPGSVVETATGDVETTAMGDIGPLISDPNEQGLLTQGRQPNQRAPNRVSQIGGEIGSVYSSTLDGLSNMVNPINSILGAINPAANQTDQNFLSKTLSSVMGTAHASTNSVAADNVIKHFSGWGGDPLLNQGQRNVSSTSTSHLSPENRNETFNKLSALGREAWDWYKKLWNENAGMAMWTTSNVISTILALLDDSEEEASFQRRHVAGFAPGGPKDVAKRYGGLPKVGKPTGMWASNRQNSLRSGAPITSRRTPTIDSNRSGLIGPKKQGALV